jgi:hypothetical protein
MLIRLAVADQKPVGDCYSCLTGISGLQNKDFGWVKLAEAQAGGVLQGFHCLTAAGPALVALPEPRLLSQDGSVPKLSHRWPVRATR